MNDFKSGCELYPCQYDVWNYIVLILSNAYEISQKHALHGL